MDPALPTNLTDILHPNDLRMNVWLAGLLACVCLYAIKLQHQSHRFKLPWWAFFAAGQAFYQIQMISYLVSPSLYVVDNLWYAVERHWLGAVLLPLSTPRLLFKCVARAVYMASISIPFFYFMEIIEYNSVPNFMFGKPHLPGVFYFFYGIQLMVCYIFCALTVYHDGFFLCFTTFVSVLTTVLATRATNWEYDRSLRHLCEQPIGYQVHREKKYPIKAISMILSQSLTFVGIDFLSIFFYYNNLQQWEIVHAFPLLTWTFSMVVDYLDLDLWYCPTTVQRVAYGYEARARSASIAGRPLRGERASAPELRALEQAGTSPKEIPLLEVSKVEEPESSENSCEAGPSTSR